MPVPIQACNQTNVVKVLKVQLPTNMFLLCVIPLKISHVHHCKPEVSALKRCAMYTPRQIRSSTLRPYFLFPTLSLSHVHTLADAGLEAVLLPPWLCGPVCDLFLRDECRLSRGEAMSSRHSSHSHHQVCVSKRQGGSVKQVFAQTHNTL